MTIIKLKSSDHEIHDIEKSLAKCVKPWRLILEQNNELNEIEVKAKSFHLHFILEWLEKHKNDDVVLHPPLVTVPEVIATLRESGSNLLTEQQMAITSLTLPTSSTSSLTLLDSLSIMPTNWDKSFLRHIPRKEFGSLLKLATDLEIKVLCEYLSNHLSCLIHSEEKCLKYDGDESDQ